MGALSYSLVSDWRYVGTGAHRRKETDLLWTIFVILLVLWAVGLAEKVTTGLIHILLVIAHQESRS